MTNVKTAIGRIESFIRPATFPVGVRMLEAGDEIPERAKRPRRDMSVEITTCQAVTMARKYGWTVALTTEDINCPLTKIAFGLEKEPAFFKDGNCCAGMYTQSAAAGRANRNGDVSLSVQSLQWHPDGPGGESSL